MKKTAVISIALCAALVLAAAVWGVVYGLSGRAASATGGKSGVGSQQVSVGDKVYTIEKLGAGPDAAEAAEKLPTVGSMEKLLSMFSEMGLFYTQDNLTGGEKGIMYAATAEAPAAEPAPARAAADTATQAAAGETGGYSQTNTQVGDVDEADIIKTDGEYIYYACNGQLAILRAEGDGASTMSVISTDDYVSNLYVAGDRLVTISTRYEYADNGDGGGVQPYLRCWWGKSYTCYVVYDITDRADPVEFRRIEIEGDPLETRLIGNTLYFVNNKYINSIAYGEAYDDYDVLPCYRDTAAGGGETEGKTIAPDAIYYCPGELQNTYIMAGAFDVTALDPCEPEAILGSGSTIYMSLNNLYVVRQNWNYGDDGNGEFQGVTTDVYRFSVDGATLSYSGLGKVPGYVINQYAMDEYNGYFRMATTTQDESWNETNNVYVLDAGLQIVGKVTGLAEGETIQSVRFDGDTGYVVTYEQTDPLFVLDLTDPAAPKVLGELKIPGFSSYLHSLGNGLLLGIGRHTTELYSRDENGAETVEGTTDKGLKISIFDVGDPTNPVEIAHKVLGRSWNTSSEVQYNPRSLMVDPGRGIVGIPITTYGGEYMKSSDNWSGYLVVDVGGGAIDILASLGGDGYVSSQRMVYIGDTLYLAKDNTVTAYSYADFSALGSTTIGFKEPDYGGVRPLPAIAYDSAVEK